MKPPNLIPSVGEKITITVVIKNIGNADAKSFSVDLFKSLGVPPDAPRTGDVPAKKVNSLKATLSTTLTFTNVSYDTAGQKKLWVLADSQDQVDEGDNEGNNYNSTYLDVTPAKTNKPDFVIKTISIDPKRPLVNDQFTAEVVVQNQGGVSGNGGTLSVWVNQPSTQECVKSNALGDKSVQVGNLGYGTQKTFKFSNLPAGTVGKKSFRAFVDSQCRTNESLENNNQYSLDYNVIELLNVEFSEGTKAIYGWDDFSNPTIAYKSIEQGKTDTIYAEISPSWYIDSCYFDSTDPAVAEVSPELPSNWQQEVTLEGVKVGGADIRAMQGGTILDQVHITTYPKVQKTVAVTLVHEKASPGLDSGYRSIDIPDSEIIGWLKKVYNQAVVEWIVERLPEKEVDFDLNHDGKLDLSSWMTDEMQLIRDACKSDHDYNIFLVSRPSADEVAGQTAFMQKYVFVFVADGNTICHELGHAYGGLKHCTEVLTECFLYDDDNLMQPVWKPNQWRLRKLQWDVLNVW